MRLRSPFVLALTALFVASIASGGCSDTEEKGGGQGGFYDLAESVAVVGPEAERHEAYGSMRIASSLGERPISIIFRVADYERLGLEERSFQISLAEMAEVTVLENEQPVRLSASLTAALDAEQGFSGNIVAFGATTFEGVDVAVGFATTKSQLIYIHDIREDCPGVVWGDDDCNNSASCINLLYDPATDTGTQHPGTCTFVDVSWNPWNYCICREN